MATVEERIRSWSHGEPSNQEGRAKLLRSWGGGTYCQRRKEQGEWKKGLVLRHIRGWHDVVRGVFLRHKGHTINRH